MSADAPLFLVSMEEAAEPLMQADAVALFQARFVLRQLDAERPGCGYAKLARACERVAMHISTMERDEVEPVDDD